jgi:hypothetical protein
MFRFRYLVVFAVLIALAVAAYQYHAGAYARLAERELSKPISHIKFKPHHNREYVFVDDAPTIQAIHSWLLGASKPSLASWPPAGCPLTIQFDDGSSVRLSISATGLTRTHIQELRSNDPSEYDGLNYATLEWNGHFRINGDQPFTDFLRRTNQIASSEPIPVSMHSQSAR